MAMASFLAAWSISSLSNRRTPVLHQKVGRAPITRVDVLPLRQTTPSLPFPKEHLPGTCWLPGRCSPWRMGSLPAESDLFSLAFVKEGESQAYPRSGQGLCG